MAIKKITCNDFIERAKQVHGDKYDYSKVEYKGYQTKVCIICPEHGEFWQAPSKHLFGQGCKECVKIVMRQKFACSTDKFVEKAKKVHGDKYDYSKVDYVNNATKVCIICPEHGEFWMTPANHTFAAKPQGCPQCGNEVCHDKLKRTTEQFITEAKGIHGDRYDYSKVEYINNETKVRIICQEHGEFWQLPTSHINKKCGCPACNLIRYNQETIIDAFNKVHNGKYRYDKVVFNNVHSKVVVTCPEHGDFQITPDGHLSGRGCSECKKTTISQKLSLGKEEFVNRATAIHGNRYDYSKVNYIAQNKKVEIICQEHGSFYQIPTVHLRGCGCPLCGNTSRAEKTVESLLTQNNIKYKAQHTWEWLKNIHHLFVDFYLPEYNIIIECQGIQHFKPVHLFGGEETFIKQQELDEIKKRLCIEHGIIILYYANFEWDFPYEVINNLEQLLTEIKKYDKDIKNL